MSDAFVYRYEYQVVGDGYTTTMGKPMPLWEFCMSRAGLEAIVIVMMGLRNVRPTRFLTR